MLHRHCAFLILLLQIINSDGTRTCFNNCTISERQGVPLVVPDNNCSKVDADFCQAIVKIRYHSREYAVEFKIASSASESRLIFLLPSDYLGYTVTYSCSDSDSCALEFARKQVLELSDRTYNLSKLWSELAPSLEESRPTEMALICSDNLECSGSCSIKYDLILNSERASECNTYATFAQVSVSDGGSYTSFEIGCTRTKCNSRDTFERVKAILASNNLTDANGRIPKESTSSTGC